LPLIARALEDKRSTVREAALESGFEEVLALPGARDVLGRVLSRLANDTSSLVRKMSSKWNG
jgi:HEAT repeat protein